MKCFKVAVLLTAFVPFTGCFQSGPKIMPVEGTVNLDGKPADKMLVEFWPTSDGPRSFGETDSSGRFKLTTDDGKREGASVGTHKVTIKDAGVFTKFLGRAGENANMSEGRKPRVAGKFATPENTTLTVTVDASKKNDFILEATSK